MKKQRSKRSSCKYPSMVDRLDPRLAQEIKVFSEITGLSVEDIAKKYKLPIPVVKAAIKCGKDFDQVISVNKKRGNDNGK